MHALLHFSALSVKDNHQKANQHEVATEERVIYRTSFHSLYYARILPKWSMPSAVSIRSP